MNGNEIVYSNYLKQNKGNYVLEEEMITQFLSAKAFAVAGASTNRAKYGNKVVQSSASVLTK
jgi:hypothetical protein